MRVRENFSSSKQLTAAALCAVVLLAFQCHQSHAALVQYLPFDGDAIANIGVNGTPINGPVAGIDRNGIAGGALAFNGTNQFVDVAGGGGLDGATQGTISMWVQWNGTQDPACCGGTFGNVISRQNNGFHSENILGLSNANPAVGQVAFQGYDHLTPTIVGGPAVGDGTYRHVAVSFQSGDQKLYVDGTLVGSNTVADTFAANGVPLSIGAWSGDGNGFARANIDDVAIFDNVLADTDIAMLADQSQTPLSLVGLAPPPVLPVKITGVTAVATSELAGNFNRVVGNIVDGVGADTTIPDGNPGDVNGSWLSHGTFRAPNDPIANAEVVFDLGTVERVGEMMVFNYNENETANLTSRGANEVIVRVSNDNFGGDDRLVDTFFFDQATGALGLPGQTIDLGGIEAQFVKFDFVSNHNGDAEFVGLNEVMFFRAAPVVPEPTTGVLVLLASVAVGYRRRRQSM